MKPVYMWMGNSQYEALRLSHDPFGIYRSRRALAKIIPGLPIYRGYEWWHG